MGLFSSNRKVSRREFQQSASALRHKGLSKSDIDNMKKVFHGSLQEKGRHLGIDRHELESGSKWMRENTSKHTLSKKQIDAMEKQLKKKL